MRCTVNEIRGRLGKIMKSIMCEEIQNIYSQIMTDDPEKIMFDYEHETDMIILEFSENLHNQNHLKTIIKSKSSEITFTLFMRYHLLTYYLINHNQNSPANVPADDKEFFIVMLTDFWKFAL